ncbi:MAG: hypothetical protein SGCHY_004074 [Lobulomycetales sp.]
MDFTDLLLRSQAVVLGLADGRAQDAQQETALADLEDRLSQLKSALEETNARYAAVDLDAILAKLNFANEHSHLLPPPSETEMSPFRLSILPTPQKSTRRAASPEPATPSQHAKKPPANETTTKSKAAKKTKKKDFVYIFPITEEEFATVPQYLAKRQTLEKVNTQLEKLNQLFKIVQKWRSTPTQKQSPDQRHDLSKYVKVGQSSEYAKICGLEDGAAYIRLIDITGKGSTVPGPSPFKFDSTGRVALGVAKHFGRLKGMSPIRLTAPPFSAEGRTSDGAFYVAFY